MNKIEDLAIQCQMEGTAFTGFRFDASALTVVVKVRESITLEKSVVLLPDQVRKIIGWIEKSFVAKTLPLTHSEDSGDGTGSGIKFSLSITSPARTWIYALDGGRCRTNNIHSREQMEQVLEWLKQVKQEMEDKKDGTHN